ncbi:hypothetical protein [Candidatus Burkholderia verschuerenii]|uniref:hypothetical protein n=1 Tax=Candidatus Burkholderia verschuerenii TaxID=242163 RepID=UPI0012EEB090|nr:hypothetical protein [Candidatus Burkholderia verschuerenii]
MDHTFAMYRMFKAGQIRYVLADWSVNFAHGSCRTKLATGTTLKALSVFSWRIVQCAKRQFRVRRKKPWIFLKTCLSDAMLPCQKSLDIAKEFRVGPRQFPNTP